MFLPHQPDPIEGRAEASVVGLAEDMWGLERKARGGGCLKELAAIHVRFKDGDNSEGIQGADGWGWKGGESYFLSNYPKDKSGTNSRKSQKNGRLTAETQQIQATC